MSGLDDIIRIALGSFRTAGLLIAMPGFTAQNIPSPIKFLFPILLSVLFFHFQNPIPPALWTKLFENSGVLLTVVAREAGIGLFIGFCAQLLFLAAQAAMEWASMQMGFSLASIFDPVNNSYVSALSELSTLLLILIFFATNIHHDLFHVLVKSYQALPIGLPDWNMEGMRQNLLSFLKTSFVTAFRLSAPVLIAMLIIQTVIGVASKTAPQMNLFFNAAFVVNIGTGFLLVMTTLPHMVHQFESFAHDLARRGYGLY